MAKKMLKALPRTFLIFAFHAAAIAGPVDWAHQNGAIQSNGSVTVKTLSGGSYSAIGNPTGAVAKANQNAATQPPTVIIQATSNGYSETLPFLNNNTTTIPTCPTGYTRIFAWSGDTNTIGSTYNSPQGGVSVIAANVGGSRWSLVVYVASSGYKMISWVADGQTLFANNGIGDPNLGLQINAWADTGYGGGKNNVVAAMCSK